MKGGELIIISAPSGAGKTSLVNAVLSRMDNIEISVSYTTRPPRPKEVNHKDYVFVDDATFLKYQSENRFLESAKVFNYHYATSKDWVQERLNAGVDVILEIDWQGAQIIQSMMSCISIFILPPSKNDLIKRLKTRDQDNEEVISYRMQKATEEMSHYNAYDYLVINDDFERAMIDLSTIIHAHRLRTTRQQQSCQKLISELLS